ncbi:MAG: hypothetical protein Kow0032_17870 [Methyloligellaceae bacterium]
MTAIGGTFAPMSISRSFDRAALVCAACLVLLPLAGAQAQGLPGQPDPARGQTLTGRLCVECHVPSDAATRLQGSADVPTFPEIARRPGQSADRIISRIILPAHPMPVISLTRDEMQDIAAYILSLRKGE